MTAFRTATNAIGGIAFGLFLVCAIPTMAAATLASGIAIPWQICLVLDAKTEENRNHQFKGVVIYFLLFLVACAGDYGLMKLVLTLNKSNEKYDQ